MCTAPNMFYKSYKNHFLILTGDHPERVLILKYNHTFFIEVQLGKSVDTSKYIYADKCIKLQLSGF